MKRIVALFVLIQSTMLFAASDTVAEKKAAEPIKFAVSAGVEYSDNRDSLPDKESNFDLFITPRLALDLKWEETTMMIGYAPTFRYRTDPSVIQNDSQLFHDLAFTFTHDPSRNVKLRFVENFNLTDDPSVQQNGSTLRRDSSFILNQTEVGANYAFSRLSNLDVFGKYMVKSYDDEEIAKESDEDRTEAGISLWHQPGKNFALKGLISYSMYGYEEYLGADRGFDSVKIGAGLEEVVSPNFRFGLRAGVQSVSYADDAIDSDNSPFGSISAQISTIPSTRVTASISHMIREAFLFPFSSQKSTDFSLRLDWDAPIPELRFGLGGTYRSGEYDSEHISPALLADYLSGAYADAYGANTSGQEDSVIVAADVAFQIGVGTKIKFVQTYEKVDSDVRWSFNRNASCIMLMREF
ncbi:MAG: hypothetical protein A2283_10635 [Lentisphaerae bacterium RIFOXYA12_FULL_48_11]|nr:MAG: hypothetical protein A2283_10635 [Lentisphaerae bacterium RIFOXYA12_FULL_48_11]